MTTDSRHSGAMAPANVTDAERNRLVAILAGYSAAVAGFIGMMVFLVAR